MRRVFLVIALVLVVAAAVLASNAGARGTEDTRTLEQRVEWLEGEVRGAYANTSYLTEHVIALQAKDAALEKRIAVLERKLRRK